MSAPVGESAQVSPLAPAAAAGALAAVLGGYRLGHESLWGDEGITAAAVARGWSDLTHYVVDERPTHGLYYGLLKLWPAGSGEVALRSMSVVCIAAAAALTAILATRLFGRAAGWCAGVLFAVNPFVISHAQNARVYALAVLLSVLASLLFVRALERPSQPRWLAYALVAAVLVYAHAVAGAVLVAHAIAFLLRRPRPWRPALVALGAALIAAAPLALAVGRSGTGSISWIEDPAPSSVYPIVRALAGGTNLLVAMLALATAFGVWVALKRDRKQAGNWGLALSGLLALVPLVVAYAVSLFVPVFLPRYLIVAVPGMVLLAGTGVASLRRPWMAAGATLLVVVACAPVLWPLHTRAQNEDWRGAAAIVTSRHAAGDVVVIDPGWAVPAFDYYWRGHAVGGKALRRGQIGDSRRMWLVTNTRARRAKTEDAARSYARSHPEQGRWRRHEILVRLYSSP